MNLEELSGRLAFYLKDVGRTRFKTPTLVAALSDSQQQFARDTGIFRVKGHVVVTLGLADLATLVGPSPIGPVQRVEDPTQDNRIIYPVTPSEMDAIGGAKWRTNVTGPIQFWLQGLADVSSDGFDSVTVWPMVPGGLGATPGTQAVLGAVTLTGAAVSAIAGPTAGANQGSGYVPNATLDVTITPDAADPDGSGAKATATVGADGKVKVNSVVVTAGGTLYNGNATATLPAPPKQPLVVYYPALPKAFVLGVEPLQADMIPAGYHMGVVWGAVVNLLAEAETPADQQGLKVALTQYEGFAKNAQATVKAFMEGR